jgi:hypothetical protein
MFLALKKKKQLNSVENSKQDTSSQDKQIRENSDSLNLDFEEESFDDNVLGGSLEPQNYHDHYDFVKNRKSLKGQWVHFLLNFVYSHEKAESLLTSDFYPKRIKLFNKKTSECNLCIFDIFWIIKQVAKLIEL